MAIIIYFSHNSHQRNGYPALTAWLHACVQLLFITANFCWTNLIYRVFDTDSCPAASFHSGWFNLTDYARGKWHSRQRGDCVSNALELVGYSLTASEEPERQFRFWDFKCLQSHFNSILEASHFISFHQMRIQLDQIVSLRRRSLLLHRGFRCSTKQQADECLTSKPDADLSKLDGVSLFREQQRAGWESFNCGKRCSEAPSVATVHRCMSICFHQQEVPYFYHMAEL